MAQLLLPLLQTGVPSEGSRQGQARSTGDEESQERGAAIICLGRMILGPPHPIPFPLWPSSLIPGLAGVGSWARARPQGHQDWQWRQWKEGQGWQSRTESRELSCRRQVACGDKERVSLGLLLSSHPSKSLVGRGTDIVYT